MKGEADIILLKKHHGVSPVGVWTTLQNAGIRTSLGEKRMDFDPWCVAVRTYV